MGADIRFLKSIVIGVLIYAACLMLVLVVAQMITGYDFTAAYAAIGGMGSVELALSAIIKKRKKNPIKIRRKLIMNDITNVIEAAVYIITAIIGLVLIPKLNLWLDSKKVTSEKTALTITREWADIAVMAAEEATRSGLIDKEAKYGYALEFLEKRGITFDAATIRALIDSSVWYLFNQFKGDGDVSE